MKETENGVGMHPQMTRLYQAAAELCKAEGQSAIAKLLNISPQRVNNWEVRGISNEGLLSAQEIIGCNAIWLRDGMGDMVGPGISNYTKVVIAEDGDPGFYQIQKVKLQLQAGITGFQTIPDIHDGSKLSVPKNWVDRNGYYPAKLIAISVKGESMEPSLYEGDQVIVNTADIRMEDGGVYAFNYEGEAVIKRLARDQGDWWLTSDNSDQRKYARKRCRNGECIIVGRVVRRETDKI
jgi:hypothetical protein